MVTGLEIYGSGAYRSMCWLCGDIFKKFSWVSSSWPVKLIGLKFEDCGDAIG